MIQELMTYLPILLQWARAQTKFRELYFVVIVASAAAVFYAISDPSAFRESWREILSGWWRWVVSIMATTQLTSSASRVAVEMNLVGADNPLIPITNSKP